MKKKLSAGLCAFVFMMVWFGCATVEEEHKGAAVGAGVGAATGAVLGAAIGKDTKSAVIGGLAGALIGGAIGHYYYDKKKTRDETAKTYNYKPEHGTILTIEDATVSSQSVKPGDVVEIKMTYAVLNPSPEAKVSITEIREITHDGELVGKPEVRVNRSDGTYSSTVPVHLPTTAKKGLYKVKTVVQSENLKDTRELTFEVV